MDYDIQKKKKITTNELIEVKDSETNFENISE